MERQANRRIYLVRGRDTTGREAWYYVRVTKKRPAVFEKDAKGGQFNLTDYGDIVLSGYGKDPPPEARKRMREEWGFED